MILRKAAKLLAAAMLSSSLMIAGALCAWAQPTGLSKIDGRNITSRQGGFEISLPQQYQVDRNGAGSVLSQGFVDNMNKSMKVDFAAYEVDETTKSYMVNLGAMISDAGAGDNRLTLAMLRQQMLDAGITDVADVTQTSLGARTYDFLRVNYGQWMIEDFYLYTGEESSYLLCQFYSPDRAAAAAEVRALFKPYTGVEGWAYNQGVGWQYMNADGSLSANCWMQDEDGLTYHLDGSARIQYNTWIQEEGGWRYADELGHMVTSVIKNIDGVFYTFGADGFLKAGSERTARDFSFGSLDGRHYTNDWANLSLTFPETAQVRLGDGSENTYALAGGEHVEVNDPELSYRITVDFTQDGEELDRYFDQLVSYGESGGYKVDFSGTVTIGGYEYKACRTTYDFGDGTHHHGDWYIRQIDGKRVELHFDYFDELKTQADSVFNSIGAADGE